MAYIFMRKRAKISLRKKDFGFGCTDRSSFEGTEIGRPLCDIGKIKLLTLSISKYVYTTCIIYSLYNVKHLDIILIVITR